MKHLTKEEKVWLDKFHIRVKERMKELEINQKQLSRLTGLPQSTTHYMMYGPHVPRITHVVMVAQALAMKPSELIDFDIA